MNSMMNDATKNNNTIPKVTGIMKLWICSLIKASRLNSNKTIPKTANIREFLI